MKLDMSRPEAMWEFLKGNIIMLAHMHGQELAEIQATATPEELAYRASSMISMVANGNYTDIECAKYLATLMNPKAGYNIRIEPVSSGASRLIGRIQHIVTTDEKDRPNWAPFTQDDLDNYLTTTYG